MAIMATGPLSSTALVPSVWLSTTRREADCPGMVADTDGVTTGFTPAVTVMRPRGC